ncbi:sulfatase-like hydrolase/transferase [Phaeobacter sp. B1627]|uniref:sulfatase-like hydrolase/transferase n=1 Tax=Phaeobacter sp. B1627 TaxID=2583809 RepID=UPI001118D454|nr:sulfatase-like hydrolase/transferase [Phaeobacter sp. B1627]TNJ47806.1 phosphonate monoester hydrolase [Phaeobacter sp. B1627]
MHTPRNILFVIFDQLRADCVSGALAQSVALPNIRQFRKEAVSFDRHMSVVTPCGPSRTSILTGQYAMNHRSVRNGTPLRHDTPNLARELRKTGLTPLLFGYTDTTQDPRQFPSGDPAMHSYEHPMDGFSEALEMRFEESYPWRAHLKSRGYAFSDYADLYRPVPPRDRAPRPRDPALYRAEDSDTAFLTDRVLDHLPALEGQSWCAHVTYIRPHPPLVAPAPYNDMYNPANLPAPEAQPTRAAEAALHPFCGPAMAATRARDMVVGQDATEADAATVQELRSVYLGLATEVDHHFGRLIAYLKQSGQYENTLVVMTADHGEMLGDHHMWGKQTFYDAAYHTPLSIRLPGNGAQAGLVRLEPTESVDLMPTILDFNEQPVPNAVDGRSLMPLLRGETPADWRRYSFSELDYGDPVAPTPWQHALGSGASDSNLAILRDARFTLVVFASDLPPVLFDHEGAGEMENVAGDPARAGDLNRMMQAMLRHRMGNMNHLLSLDAVTPEGPKQARRHR